jgi:putative flippase GtrA
MKAPSRLKTSANRAITALKKRAMVLKAISFALVGVVNTAIDASVFFVAYGLLGSSPGAAAALSWFADACGCGNLQVITLIAANVLAWFVAVSFSYVMNSMITFAAESGRELKWQAYGTFLASGVVGVIANTTTLVVAAHFLPVWAAKALAILVGFVVNFSMSHFVVFRARKTGTQ